MAQFRAKKLDLSCFVNIKVIRDHTKRKVFEQYETQRSAQYFFQSRGPISYIAIKTSHHGERFWALPDHRDPSDKLSATSSATLPYHSERAPKHSYNSPKCMPIHDRPKSTIGVSKEERVEV
ncbi:MAG: hypothetical protein Q9208_000722 [Pyrenodesmia sp. 3 TL-2023]